MAPAKFDDFSKAAKDLLADDFKDKGVSFKAKAKTNFEGVSDLTGADGKKEGATLTTAIDFDFGGKCATPAKLTFKFPKPLGVAGIAFDKFEMDKGGKLKLEASVDKALHGVSDLKIDVKSDCASVDATSVGATFTGIANALAKAEIKATNPGDYSAEFSYAVMAGATVGVKSTKASALDVAAQYVNGPMFFSAVGKDSFSAFTFHGHYKAMDDLKVAATYDFGGKNNGKFSAGLAYNIASGMSFKGKINGSNGSDLALSAALKKDLAKGVTVTAGGSMPMDGKTPTWGMAFNIE